MIAAGNVTTLNGSIQITGIAGGLAAGAADVGVDISGMSSLVVGGAATTITIAGTGGVGTGMMGGNNGVNLKNLASSSTGGGNVLVTGIEGGGTNAFAISGASTLSLETNGGDLTYVGDTMEFESLNATILLHPNSVLTLKSRTVGKPIDLGTQTPGSLSLRDIDLDRFSGGTLQIGEATSGPITISADITRSAATPINLTSSGAINFTTGSINTGGGNLLLSPGSSASVSSIKANTDASVGTLAFANNADFTMNISGNTPDSQYQVFNVVGQANITGVDLVLTGSYVPVEKDSFTIVETTTGLTGTFNGLPNNSVILFNGIELAVKYSANKATLTLASANESPTAISLSSTSTPENVAANSAIAR